jgi:hypothetical protein
MPNKVFISYRREDSRYQARRVYDAFVHALPPDTVFMDVDSIPPGADFVEILEGWVKQCDVLLALIGPNWLNSIDPRTSLRRLDNSEDFVRIEIRGALERKIPVVPVLLDATEMPTAAELPDDIKALRRRHAEFVDFRTFDADVQRLIKRLKIGKKIEPIAPNPEPPAEDSGDRKGDVPGPDVPAARSEPDSVKIAPLRIWPAVAVSLAVIVAILLAARVIERGHLDVQDGQASAASDALKTSDTARREAEARLAAALAAQDKAEQASKAAEKSANDTADELKKSEKARSDADDRATKAAAAQAKAEEAQRTAEKARAAAEGAASGAAIARQAAEKRASDAIDALVKSEQSSLLPNAVGPISRWTLLDDGTGCNVTTSSSYYTLEVSANSVTWRNGAGVIKIETISSRSPNEFTTTTSQSDVGPPIGTQWTYSRDGDRIRVKVAAGGYTLRRCP